MSDYKQLYLSEKNEMIGGVCGGLGEYFGVDPTIVRLVFAGSLLFGGAGFWIYIALWILLPEEGDVRRRNATYHHDDYVIVDEFVDDDFLYEDDYYEKPKRR